MRTLNELKQIIEQNNLKTEFISFMKENSYTKEDIKNDPNIVYEFVAPLIWGAKQAAKVATPILLYKAAKTLFDECTKKCLAQKGSSVASYFGGKARATCMISCKIKRNEAVIKAAQQAISDKKKQNMPTEKEENLIKKLIAKNSELQKKIAGQGEQHVG